MDWAHPRLRDGDGRPGASGAEWGCLQVFGGD